MHQKIISITQMLRLPSVCVLCNQYHHQPYAVCQACCEFFKAIGPACRYCAFPLPDENFLVCGQCSRLKPAFDRTFVAYRFEEPLRNLLHEYKYHGGLYLRNFLVKLMLDAIANTPITTQCLIPVPLHPKRLKQRGFNQAAEFSKLLAKHLNVPCALTICKKIRHTQPQVNLSGKERKQNLHHAFQVKATAYQHVTLVDDLLTTGSTVNELASLLKKQGVSQVDVWCCARAAGD
ncbi:ComF family protein [Tatlockia sp. PL877]|uniref:ComF family protein n=1 Tax=Legionella sp. W10-070 TaxID=1117709 RepID=UPI001F5E7EB3|nr:ComF family protein [Legionella sp. W10-070]MDI9819092.1 ComF family protein [Legionella sp. PL877]